MRWICSTAALRSSVRASPSSSGSPSNSASPDKAAQILNTIADKYVAHQMGENSSLQDEGWVKDRLADLSNRVSIAQKALRDLEQKALREIERKKGTALLAVPRDAGAAPSQPMPQTQEKLHDLTAALAAAEADYDNFRHVLRQMEAAQHERSTGMDARLIAEASPPQQASSPKAGLALGLASVAGLVLGVAIGMRRDLSDRGVRAGGREWKDLHSNCLAVVPKVPSYNVWGKLTGIFSSLAERRVKKPAAEKFLSPNPWRWPGARRREASRLDPDRSGPSSTNHSPDLPSLLSK